MPPAFTRTMGECTYIPDLGGLSFEKNLNTKISWDAVCMRTIDLRLKYDTPFR